MNNINYELNYKLYLECLKEKIDLVEIEKLLIAGANPLGTYNEKDTDENTYGEVLLNGENIYVLTELFLKYGMKINHSDYRNDGDSIDPLWNLAFNINEEGLRTLKLLLDNHTDLESIEESMDHIDIDTFAIYSPRGDYDNFIEKSIKMIMLSASYEYVYKNSDYIKKLIDATNNSYAISNFKNIENYIVTVEYTDNSDRSEWHNLFNKVIIHIYDKNTNKCVWSIKNI